MLPRLLFPLFLTTALAVPAAATTEMPAAQPRPADTSSLHYVPPAEGAALHQQSITGHLAIFTPTTDPIRHRIDYEIWDYALKNMVLSMGPPDRQSARRTDPITGTRIKQGPQSRYRLEGSVLLFRFLDTKVLESFTEYRKDLESVTETLDIASLPRNEQLAFWLNLHNVALLEQLAYRWPLREPREMLVGGVPLDEARIITVKGVPVSMRDIRENIVFRHWKDPKVIYGFWRGEIGGPELQRHAFTGANVGSLLDIAATDYINSLRGTQQRGETLDVASLYAEVAPFYFRDFDTDLRAHLARYAEAPVTRILADTRSLKAVIDESEIADLNGGARPINYLFVGSLPGAMDDPLAAGCSERVGQAACDLVQERTRKLMAMQRRDQPIARVFFSNIDLPGDPPNKNAVE
jgi:Protein of unknown function, DUF547